MSGFKGQLDEAAELLSNLIATADAFQGSGQEVMFGSTVQEFFAGLKAVTSRCGGIIIWNAEQRDVAEFKRA